MDTETKPAQRSDSVKKPYQAPELVVMGDAAAMTQSLTGAAVDDAIISEDLS